MLPVQSTATVAVNVSESPKLEELLPEVRASVVVVLSLETGIVIVGAVDPV